MATQSYSWWTTTLTSSLVNNVIKAGNQADPAITALADGSGYFMTWDTSGAPSDIGGRLFRADGTPLTNEFPVNSTTTNNQYDSSVATLSNGNIVVTYTDTSTDAGGEIRARLFTSSGVPIGSDFIAATSARPDTESDVVALADGGFVVTWTTDFGSGDKDIRAQIFNSDGTPRGFAIPIDSDITLNTNSSQVVGLANGNFVVVWEQEPKAGGDTEVCYRIYDATGAALTNAQVIGTNGSINEDIQVAALQDGGFAVAYADNGWEWLGGAGTDITVRGFNANGQVTWTHVANGIALGTTPDGDQIKPTLTVLSNGYVDVGWDASGFERHQTYDAAGNIIGENTLAVNGGGHAAEVVALADGKVAYVWASNTSDGAGDSIRTAILQLVRYTTGDATDEVLAGDGLCDWMYGAGGHDTLWGGGGDDTLVSGTGNDRLDAGRGVDEANYWWGTKAGVKVDLALTGAQNTGGGGIDTLISMENLTGSKFNDTLKGNAQANYIDGKEGIDVIEGRGGNDTLDGGQGLDWASYASAPSGVKVSLMLQGASQNTLGAGNDTLSNFENLIGSARDDFLTGNTNSNQLNGGAGADVLVGLIGDDTLDGGAGSDKLYGDEGFDWASYASAGSAVKVSLAITGAQNTLGAGLDALFSIENLSGSKFNDTLTGNGAGNYLKGAAGSDTLNGAGGIDTLDGGAGNDTLNGGAGSDWASYDSAGAAVKVTLASTALQNTGGAGIDKLISIENLIGSHFGDTLTGNAGSNMVLGGHGNDTINGGAGDDILIGQDGADRLTGGAGNDAFMFQSLSDSTLSLHDLITDFSTGDRIDLSAIDADTGTFDNQAFHLDGTIGGAGDIGITFDAANNRTVIDLYVNNDATVDATIWLSGNHTNLTAADFVL